MISNERSSPLDNRRNFHEAPWPRLEESALNPKSEIETGNLTQSLGHKRIEKISTEHFGYASIFSIRFCSKILRHLAGLNFGFRAKTAKSRPLAGFGNG